MSILLIFPISIFITAVFDKKIENTISIGFCIAIVVLFYAGFFTSFTKGIYFIIVLSVFCLIAGIYLLCKKERWARIFTPGMAFLIIFILYSMISCMGRFYGNQDEYAAWAVGCKYMYQFDHYIVNGTPLYACFEHMPGTRLLDLLSTKLWVRYADGIMILGQSIWTVSFVLPVIEHFSFKDNKGKRLCAFSMMLFLIFLPRLGSGGSFNYVNIMPDVVLAFESAYVIMMFRRFLSSEDWFYALAIFCGIFTSALTKESGIIIAGLDILLMLWVILAKKEGQSIGWSDKRIFLFVISQILGVLLPTLSWFGFLSTQNTSIRRTESFTNVLKKIPIGGFFTFGILTVAFVAYLIKKYHENHQKFFILTPIFILFALGCVGMIVLGKQEADVFCAQLNSFLYKLLSNLLLGHWLPLSILSFMTFVIGGDVLIRYQRKWESWMKYFIEMLLIAYGVSLIVSEKFVLWKILLALAGCVAWSIVLIRMYRSLCNGKDNASSGEYDTEIIVKALLACGVMYLVFLFATYSIGFSTYEASIAASADRYEQTYLLLMLIVFVDLWLDNTCFESVRRSLLILFVILSVVLNTDVLAGIQQLWEIPEEDIFYGTENTTFSFSDKICLVDVQTHYDEDTKYRFLYSNYPVQVVYGPTWSWYEEDKLYTTRVPVHKVRDYLKNEDCNYVYLQFIDDGFKECYATLFEDESSIENNRLFHVVEKEGKIYLEYVS